MPHRTPIKPTVVVAALGTAAVVAAGCSSSKKVSSAPPAASATSAAPTGPPIKIGAAVPLSGPSANVGAQKSMEYAVKQINDAGGVNGSRLQLDVQDIGSTAATALSAARIFAQNKDVAVVGYSLTTQNLAVTPVFQQAKIISMLGTAS